jgi:FkbM family methyltransferase
MTNKITHIFKAFISLFSKQRRKLVVDVINLEIDSVSKSRIDPFIKLNDGTIFYGFPPSLSQQVQYYIWLIWWRKPEIPVFSYGVASDIVVRYLEHGLKYGGPNKEKYYQPQLGDTVSEMGAYLGHYIVKLSRAVGPAGRVIAIEPMPRNLDILKRNVKENNLENVTIVPYGVWSENCSLNIITGKAGQQANSLIDTGDAVDSTSEIQVRTLDTIFKKAQVTNVNFMVIQLNGTEIDALNGLNEVTASNISIAARYSTDKKNRSPDLISECLYNRNYDVKIEDKEFVFASLKE